MSISGDQVFLKDLTTVYLALAYGTDAHLAESELDTMKEKLGEWAPDLTDKEVGELIMESLAGYMQGNRDDLVTDSMLRIRTDFPKLHRLAVIDDLMQIAEADGIVLESESGLMKALQKIWKLNLRAQA